MKKLVEFLWIISLSSIIIGLNSCKTNDESIATREINKQEATQLIANLESFNKNLLKQKESTRGFTTSLFKFLAISGADILGAWEGGKVGGVIGSIGGPAGTAIGAVTVGLICGTGASYLAYETCSGYSVHYNPDMYSGPIYVYDNPAAIYTELRKIEDEQRVALKKETNISVNFPDEYKLVENVGIDHNIILENLVRKEPTKSIGEITFSEQLDQNDSTVLNYLSNPDFVAQYQSIQDKILNAITEIGAIDLEVYYANPEGQQVSSTAKKIMELFMEIYTKYPDGFDDIDTIINYYIQKIESADFLTQEEKECLYSGLSVAAYSPRFWADRFENEMSKDIKIRK